MPIRREPDPVIDRLAARALARASGSLAANLYELRVAAGLTQEAVAARTGLSDIYVKAIERNAYDNPTLRTIALLAEAVGSNVSRLLEDRDAPRPRPPGRPSAALRANTSKVPPSRSPKKRKRPKNSR